MVAYLPYSDPPSDDANIRINGMWYQEWQGGYHDILKRGYPRPKHKTTILAELHSPATPDFLHGGAADVPFLVSPRARSIMRKLRLTGVRFSSVEIVKVATKGKRRTRSRVGEPEDLILKAADQSNSVRLPTLYAARVVGRLEVIPEYPSGRCPRIGYVSPYDLPAIGEMPDLWRPTIQGRTFSAWVYCSQRFRDVAEGHDLTNIGFEPFTEHMARFRQGVTARLAELIYGPSSQERAP
jgi:hypothetical protein